MKKAKLTLTAYSPEGIMRKLYVDDQSQLVIVGDGCHSSKAVHEMITRLNALPYDNLYFAEIQKWEKLPPDLTRYAYDINHKFELQAAKKSGAAIVQVDVDYAEHREAVQVINKDKTTNAILNIEDTETRHKVYSTMCRAAAKQKLIKEEYDELDRQNLAKNKLTSREVEREYGKKLAEPMSQQGRYLQDNLNLFLPKDREHIKSVAADLQISADSYRKKGVVMGAFQFDKPPNMFEKLADIVSLPFRKAHEAYMFLRYDAQRLDVSNPFMIDEIDKSMRAKKDSGKKPVGQQVVGAFHFTFEDDLNEKLADKGYGNKNGIVPTIALIRVTDPLMNNKVWKADKNSDYVITVYDPNMLMPNKENQFDIKAASKLLHQTSPLRHIGEGLKYQQSAESSRDAKTMRGTSQVIQK